MKYHIEDYIIIRKEIIGVSFLIWVISNKEFRQNIKVGVNELEFLYIDFGDCFLCLTNFLVLGY